MCHAVSVHFLLLFTGRYTRDVGNKQTVRIQPPFQTPESLKMSPIKVEDNGFQTEMTSVTVIHVPDPILMYDSKMKSSMSNPMSHVRNMSGQLCELKPLI